MNKKKAIIISAGFLLLAAVFSFLLWITIMSTPLPDGTVDNVFVKPLESELFTEQDYYKAVECVKEYFPKYKNCELREIHYAGDDTITNKNMYTDSDYEYIELISKFYVKPSTFFQPPNEAWPEGHTYYRWSWSLKRQKADPDWTIYGCGQG